jgi:hypothetical protein
VAGWEKKKKRHSLVQYQTSFVEEQIDKYSYCVGRRLHTGERLASKKASRPGYFRSMSSVEKHLKLVDSWWI